MPIDASTRCCAVYGFPVRHSASPAMQNAGLAALGLNWRYLAFEVPPAELREAIVGAKAMRFAGLNLTVPHKLLALELVDVLDDSAKTWGAVNTIRFEWPDATGQWLPVDQVTGEAGLIRAHGFNTDADAITRSLREDLGVEIRGAKVLLLGAGGAGRVAALKLAGEGAAELFLVNRTPTKAEEIARELRVRFSQCRVTVGYPGGAVDLLLNATSLGLHPGDASPLAGAPFELRRAGAVYDMIYRPAETPLLRAAKAAGCRVANGLGMLLYQGAQALEIWTGRPAPLEVMRRALMEHVYGH
jgi:shikimate dehydrogenase